MAGEHYRAGHRIAEFAYRCLLELDFGAIQRDAADAGIGVRRYSAFFLARGEQRIRCRHTGTKSGLAEAASVHR